MLARTDQPEAGWDVVAGESKHYARVSVVETVIERIEAGMRRSGLTVPKPLTTTD
jgi:polyphosphate kinase 2 (PPK2 family)